MNLDLVVSGSIVINADLARVWDVLTNPVLIKEYLFGTETITDWKVGNGIIFQGEWEGHTYKDKGVVRENMLHKRISYSYWSSFYGTEDKPENYSLVIYELSAVDATHTNFTWTNKGFLNEERQKHSQDGMQAFMEQIKTIAER